MSRTLVVGFDGATLEMCERWQREGRMPTLAAIRTDGAWATMRSTAPYNSAVAWTSLSTGVNPGRHGIFDFVLPREGAYGYRVATRHDRRVPAIWNYASEAGARVAVVNVPMTFPAEPVNGFMVSGMDAPRLDVRAVHPVGLLERLGSGSAYRIMSKAAHAAERGEFELVERELVEVLHARVRHVCTLARRRDLDLIVVNFEATDGAHHFLWQHHDPSHPRHDHRLARQLGDGIGRVYEATDRELGALTEAFAPDTVFVVSDHGGGPSSDWVLFMNDWLAGEGFLKLAPRTGASVGRRLYGQARRRLSVPARRALRPLFGRILERAKGAALYGDFDWSSSKAYAHMQPAVRLNLAGREPRGSVGVPDREATLADIGASARNLRLPTGEPVVMATRRAEEVYAGEARGGPDLILELTPGMHVRSRNTTGRPGFLQRLHDTGMYLPSGVHSPVGMVAAAGTGIERAGRVPECDIHQVAASVLAVMGVPSPDLDGRPFSFVTASVHSTGIGPRVDDRDGTGLASDEEAEVMDRLRGLGYVD